MDFSDIVWVLEGPHLQEHIASARYMAHIPARHLGGRVLPFSDGEDAQAFLARERPRALILGKPFGDALVRLAEAARAARIPVAATMADWHFDRPNDCALARLADRIVVQTEAMAQAVAAELGRTAELIEESFEGPRGAPAFAPHDPVRLTWYGHAHNLDTLAAGLATLAPLAGHPMAIRLVTNAPPDRIAPIMAGLPKARSPVSVDWTPWSVESQAEAAAWADLVLLPSLARADKAVKGHNRLVQAIHAGRLALAFPLPPYCELADYCWIGDDMAAGLEWALAHPDEVLARIRAGQAYIDRRFSPAATAGRWSALIASMTGG